MAWVRRLLAAAVLAGGVLTVAPGAEAARRVALVVGQDAYPGGGAAVKGLPALANSRLDARRMAALLATAGFEVISCDGRQPGCYDLNGAGFTAALARLAARAEGADLALVFFAGHGFATEQGNILAPTDAKVDCATGAVTRGVLVEETLKAASAARDKLIILDACRNNPLVKICPGLAATKLAFTRIEPPEMQGLLIVTSTQFGQEARDGPPGKHSPFATALFTALEANPSIYFEQVMNEVARITAETVKADYGVAQIPGKVVGGAAPTDCLAGKGCAGDLRMAALSADVERLAAESRAAQADAAGVRNVLDKEERDRGKPFTVEERTRRIAEISGVLGNLATFNEPKRQEANRLITKGDVSAGQAKLEEALDDDEKSIAEAQRVANEKRKTAARCAHDLAVLAKEADVLKALAYFQRATRLDPSDAQTWQEYGRVAFAAGRLDEAKAAFEQAAVTARASEKPLAGYWATLALGDVAKTQGSLPEALRLYGEAGVIVSALAKAAEGQADAASLKIQQDVSESYDKVGEVLAAQGKLPAAFDSFNAALAIRDRLVKSDPANSEWQSKLSVSYNRVGEVLVTQGNLPGALDRFKAAFAIRERLAKSEPGKLKWQRDLSWSLEKIGKVLVDQGNLAAALDSFKAALAIRDRLAKADFGNAGWQHDVSASHGRIGDILVTQGNLPAALESFKAGAAIIERLAKSEPRNVGWQRDLSVSNEQLGNVYVAQGNLAAALEQFRASLDRMVPIRDRDPSNSYHQRFTLVTNVQIGDALAALGNRATALDNYTAALAIAERLAKSDPGNLGWQRDLLASYFKVAEVHSMQGNLGAALESFKAGFGIADRLAKTDPRNTDWQRNLSVSHERVGNVLTAQGNLVEGLASYKASLAIRERLSKTDPRNTQWQRDLSVSHERVGNVLLDQGSLPAALDSYKASLMIRERLVSAGPGNASWQRDVSEALRKIGDVLIARGDFIAALDSYKRALTIAERLATSDPGNAGWQRDMAQVTSKVGDVLAAQGNPTGAVDRYLAALAIRERLAKSDPGNTGWQRDVAASEEKIGDMLVAQGNLPEARDRLASAFAVRDRLAKSDAGNAGWQAELAASHSRFGRLALKQGDRPEALRLFKAGRAIIQPIAERSGHQRWIGQLRGFDADIAALAGR